LFALVFCFALIITPVYNAHPLLWWFARFSPHPTVLSAVVNSHYVDWTPLLAERRTVAVPDTLYVASQTMLEDRGFPVSDVAAWVDRRLPGGGADLSGRLVQSNRRAGLTPRVIRSPVPVRYVEPDSIPALMSRRHRCQHHHDLDCGLSGPLIVSRPAFSTDGTWSLVHAQEPFGRASAVGRFFLLKRGDRGWTVVHWWWAWAETTDPDGSVHLYRAGLDGGIRLVPAPAPATSDPTAEAAARLTR
jgi:hypothetical protein